MFILKNATQLIHLDLSRNHLLPSLGPCIHALLLSSHCLEYLDLSHNFLAEAVDSIGRGLSQSRLKVLRLADNAISDPGLVGLSHSMRGNHTLRVVDFGQNQVSSFLKDHQDEQLRTGPHPQLNQDH